MSKLGQKKTFSKATARKRRSGKTRAQIRKGDKPRICVYRSNQHISAQLTDALGHHVIAAASTKDKALRDQLKGTKTEQAKFIGSKLAEAIVAKGIKQVAFDRSGYKYHGRVKAIAEGAREGGVEF